ncbi:MAG: transcriptional repressor [Desulfomicrobiaceae bacterium]
MREYLKKDMRLTSQRQVILEELRSVTTHPTAEEVYAMAKRRLPRISLGTVYRNLDVLADLGLVRVLEMASQQRRFDADMRPHHHIRCQVCGRVDDIWQPLALSMDLHALDTPYHVTGYELELTGICPQCQQRQEEPTPPQEKNAG